ncbi:MAG: hypothetical protein ACJ8DQ_11505 [Xanthobacteraceae bacterium]
MSNCDVVAGGSLIDLAASGADNAPTMLPESIWVGPCANAGAATTAAKATAAINLFTTHLAF